VGGMFRKQHGVLLSGFFLMSCAPLGNDSTTPRSNDAGSAAGAGGGSSAGGAGGTAAGASGGSGGGGSGGGGAGGSGGGAGGSGGASGAGGTGTGGSSGSGGASRDGGPTGGDAAADTAPAHDVAPLMECAGASLDRFQKWLAHALVAGAAPDSSILVAEGNRQVARARFVGGDWSEVVVLLGNATDASIDLGKSSGFDITYSATADLYIELRGTVQLHGGDQHAVTLPATGGMTVTKHVPLDPAAWSFVAALGKPTVAFADVVRTANMFDIVGNTANTVTFSGLRFDNYVPPCR
jgi:hypothetical protein